MSLREQWIRPLDALPQDYQHVIAITSSGQEEEMYLVDDKWHIVDGVRIPIECVVFWHEKREQSTVEMAEDCISREALRQKLQEHHDFFVNAYGSYKDMTFKEKARVDEINNCIAMAVNAPSVLPQPKTLSDAEINTFIDSMKNMRKATKEESKSTVEYIDSISKPTGFLFDEAYEEIVFVETHKKLSANLQLCNDCISREQAVYVASGYCAPQNIADELRKLPSVTPQPKRGKWIQHNEDIECPICHIKWDWLDNEIHKFDFCPKCGADMRGGI